MNAISVIVASLSSNPPTLLNFDHSCFYNPTTVSPPSPYTTNHDYEYECYNVQFPSSRPDTDCWLTGWENNPTNDQAVILQRTIRSFRPRRREQRTSHISNGGRRLYRTRLGGIRSAGSARNPTGARCRSIQRSNFRSKPSVRSSQESRHRLHPNA